METEFTVAFNQEETVMNRQEKELFKKFRVGVLANLTQWAGGDPLDPLPALSEAHENDSAKREQIRTHGLCARWCTKREMKKETSRPRGYGKHGRDERLHAQWSRVKMVG